MNGKEFTKYVSDKSGHSQREIRDFLELVTECIPEIVSSGDKLTISGFGTFYISDRPARVGKNPRTGDEMKIPSYKSPKFRPGKTFKETVNL